MGATAVLVTLYLQAKVLEKTSVQIHTISTTGAFLHLFAVGGKQGGKDGGQDPTTNPAISLQPHISFLQSKMPQLC